MRVPPSEASLPYFCSVLAVLAGLGFGSSVSWGKRVAAPPADPAPLATSGPLGPAPAERQLAGRAVPEERLAQRASGPRGFRARSD